MPGMYLSEEYDLAGFAVGVVERLRLLPSAENKLVEGDVAIGIASSGFHSNGFSLVRKVLEVNGISMDEKCPFDGSRTVGEMPLDVIEFILACFQNNVVVPGFWRRAAFFVPVIILFVDFISMLIKPSRWMCLGSDNYLREEFVAAHEEGQHH